MVFLWKGITNTEWLPNDRVKGDGKVRNQRYSSPDATVCTTWPSSVLETVMLSSHGFTVTSVPEWSNKRIMSSKFCNKYSGIHISVGAQNHALGSSVFILETEFLSNPSLIDKQTFFLKIVIK